MKAIELNIVFEDDDGKTHTASYAGNDAHVICQAIKAARRSPAWEHKMPDKAETVGPVLRKVTEYTGHLHAHFTNTMLPPGTDEPDENGIVGSLNENVDAGEHAQTGVLDDAAELAIDRRVLPFRLLRYDESPHEPGDDKIVGTYSGPDYRVRLEVTAVRVPDPSRDARELCGLPEKKP